MNMDNNELSNHPMFADNPALARSMHYLTTHPDPTTQDPEIMSKLQAEMEAFTAARIEKERVEGGPFDHLPPNIRKMMEQALNNPTPGGNPFARNPFAGINPNVVKRMQASLDPTHDSPETTKFLESLNFATMQVPAPLRPALLRVKDFIEDYWAPFKWTLQHDNKMPEGKYWKLDHGFDIGVSDEYFLLHLYIHYSNERKNIPKPWFPATTSVKEACTSCGVLCATCNRPKDVLGQRQMLFEECVCDGTTSKRLLLGQGKEVRLHGLKTASLNGCRGKLGPFNIDKGRHLVHVLNQETNKYKKYHIRVENVSLATSPQMPPWSEFTSRFRNNDDVPPFVHKLVEKDHQRRAEARKKKKVQNSTKSNNFGTEMFGKQMKEAKKKQKKDHGGKAYRCSGCEKVFNTPMKECSRCHSVAYCNSVCQKAHWKQHKAACNFHKENPHGLPQNRHSVGRIHPMEKMAAQQHVPIVRPDALNASNQKLLKKMFNTNKKVKALVRFVKRFAELVAGSEWDKGRVEVVDGSAQTREQHIHVFRSSARLYIPFFISSDKKEQQRLVKEHKFFSIYETLKHTRAMGVELFDTMVGSDRWVVDVVGKQGLLFMEFCAGIGCNMNYIDSHESGWSLMHQAAAGGNTDMIRFLSKEGIDPNMVTAKSSLTMTTWTCSTPLHLAAMFHQEASVVALCSLEHIDVNRRNSYGKAPLLNFADSYQTIDTSGTCSKHGRNTEPSIIICLEAMKEAGADLNITVDQCWEGGTRRIPGKVHQEVSIVGFNFKDLSTNWTCTKWAIENGIKETQKKFTCWEHGAFYNQDAPPL